MPHYVFGLSIRRLMLKWRGNPTWFFSAPYANSVGFLIAERLPFFGGQIRNALSEPPVTVGTERGLFYRVQREALECTDFLAPELGLAGHPFVRTYNRRFGTGKLVPFVLKWTSFYVLDLMCALHKVRLHASAPKVLHLEDTRLNRLIWDWWSRRWAHEITVRWHRTPEPVRFLEAVCGLLMVNFLKLGLRWPCLRTRPKRFRIMKEAVWGVGGNPSFRDDFFIDGRRLHRDDLLLYLIDERWRQAFREGVRAGYAGVVINRLPVPVGLLCGRLFREYVLWPMQVLGEGLRRGESYLVGQWLMAFHGPALEYEVLLAHYKVCLELSKKEETLRHIPETIVLNRHGAKNAIFHWSDLAQADYVSNHYKAFNINLVWGPVHWKFFTAPHYFVDRTVETGCWLEKAISERAAAKIAGELGLSELGRRPVIVFYDGDFNDDLPFTEEVCVEFWEMIEKVLLRRKDAIGILKLKVGEEWYEHAFKRKRAAFDEVRRRCLETRRLYLVDPSRSGGQRIGLADVIAVSTLNITMGVCTPSTLALLHGKAGIYYDTTGNEGHPFARLYRGKLVFDSVPPLLKIVDRVIDEGYDPLGEIDSGLLAEFDSFRDGGGRERFIEALAGECEAWGEREQNPGYSG